MFQEQGLLQQEIATFVENHDFGYMSGEETNRKTMDSDCFIVENPSNENDSPQFSCGPKSSQPLESKTANISPGQKKVDKEDRPYSLLELCYVSRILHLCPSEPLYTPTIIIPRGDELETNPQGTLIIRDVSVLYLPNHYSNCNPNGDATWRIRRLLTVRPVENDLNMGPYFEEKYVDHSCDALPTFLFLFPRICPSTFTPVVCQNSECKLKHGICSSFEQRLKDVPNLDDVFLAFKWCTRGIILKQTFPKFLKFFNDMHTTFYLAQMVNYVDHIYDNQLDYGLKIVQLMKQRGISMPDILWQSIYDARRTNRDFSQTLFHIALFDVDYPWCYHDFRRIVVDNSVTIPFLEPSVINSLLSRYLRPHKADADFFKGIHKIIRAHDLEEYILPGFLMSLKIFQK